MSVFGETRKTGLFCAFFPAEMAEKKGPVRGFFGGPVDRNAGERPSEIMEQKATKRAQELPRAFAAPKPRHRKSGRRRAMTAADRP